MWTIHQPKPRAASRQSFAFLNIKDPPEQEPQQGQLLTPSSTPELTPPARRLTIPDLVSANDHHGKANTFQAAAVAFEKAQVSGDALLMYDHAEEGEYLLSARPWEAGECRRANQDLWDQLAGHIRVSTPPPVHVPIAQPAAALSYLTPPTTPEPGHKCDLVARSAHVGPSNVPDSALAHDSVDSSNVLADPIPSQESLEYPSDYEDNNEWAAESPCSSGRCTPAKGEPIYTTGYNKDTINPERPFPPILPGNFPLSNTIDTSPLDNRTMCPRINRLHPKVKNLTTQLDISSFSEWPIARGGFGEVWKGALASSTPGEKGRPVAVKRLIMYTAAEEEGRRKIKKRAYRELRIWSRLDHPNVLPLMGACFFRGELGIVSEWQENGNAMEWVRTNPDVDRLDLCQGICAGLEYLHNTKPSIVHGDLRGSNIMISKNGVPRLIDFGLASATDGNPFSVSSTLAGTIRWMAPELQVTEGQGVTTAGDMFAFGMTMLELYTGLPPFSAVGNDIAVLLKYQKGERPPRPSRTKESTNGSNQSKSRTRTDLPQRRSGNIDVCELMDDETWGQVEKCWAQESSSRPSADKMLEWFVNKKKRRDLSFGLATGTCAGFDR